MNWGHVSTFHIRQTRLSPENCSSVRRRGVFPAGSCLRTLMAMPAAVESLQPLVLSIGLYGTWNVETCPLFFLNGPRSLTLTIGKP